MSRGSITRNGYRRISGARGVPAKFEHVLVWEAAHGRLPAEFQIHHRDFDKLNNALSNLQKVTPTEHSRIHRGCQLRGEKWFKRCGDCASWKEICADLWYFSRGWPLAICKPCQIRRAVETKRRRKTGVAKAMEHHGKQRPLPRLR